MPNIWFTADFHFDHANIIRYCNRPFANVEEINYTILDRLNTCVKPKDILYFLGDFCIGPKHRAREFRKTNSLQEDLRRAQQSRQGDPETHPGIRLAAYEVGLDNEYR